MAKLRTLQIIYPYYENPTMLRLQLEHWLAYPREILDKVRFLIVDDGSPNNPAEPILRPYKDILPIKLFRVEEDIPWNQHVCRNIAMKYTGKDWAFMSDMDLVLTAENVQKLFDMEVKDNCHYTFERKKMPGQTPYKPHPNTFLVTSKLFWKINGYNSNYAGTYGGDGQVKRDFKLHSYPIHVENIWVEYYGRTFVTDSGTNNYDRDYYKKLYRAKLSDLELRNNWNPINCEYTEVF